MHNIVIVGSGPAGYTAAIYAARANLSPVMYTGMQMGGQLTTTTEVDNFPGYPEGVDGPTLMEDLKKQAERFGTQVRFGMATKADFSGKVKRVEIDEKTVIEADSVILATGATAKYLGLESEEKFKGFGVSACATCDGFFYRDKVVAVVGGGDTAAEEALYLAKLAEHVYLVHRRDALRASMILQQRVKDECKIEILWNTVVTEITANDEGVDGVSLEDTQTGEKRKLTTDGVFIFVGFVPNNQLVPAGIKMNADGYVVTNEKCETNMPGIYVIGDLREKYAKQIVVAAADGCTAALVAAYHVEMKKSGEAVCELPEEILSEAQ